MIQINKEMLSFADMPEIAERSKKTVLLLRHSYRESLAGGNLDPGLTAEGVEYARQCGAFLSGMKDLCYGASYRKRCSETIQALVEGGSLEKKAIVSYLEITDTSLFEKTEDFAAALNEGNISALLTSYFTVGTADRMIPLAEYHRRLVDFLTTTAFPNRNTILASHDIVTASLLLPFNIYPFSMDDWCGNVQGGALYQDFDGHWTVAYIVPDKHNRKKHALFI